MSNVIYLPTAHARSAAQRIAASVDELDAIAAEVEQIVQQIRTLIEAQDCDRARVLARIDAMFSSSVRQKQ